MDILYFVKEEYAVLRQHLSTLVGCESSQLADESLRNYLKQVELVTRVADELILPELSENAKRGLSALVEAGDQVADLSKVIASGLKSGRLGEGKRKELASKLSNHIEYMESIVLPMVRVEIATQVREELGIVAMDIKMDLFGPDSTVAKADTAAIHAG